MDRLRSFLLKLPSDLRDDFKDFLEYWETNRMYYVFQHSLTDVPRGFEDSVSFDDLESMQIVNSIEVDDLLKAIEKDRDFGDLVSEPRYGSIDDVSQLTKEQIRGLINKISQNGEILFLNMSFEVINREIEGLLQ